MSPKTVLLYLLLAVCLLYADGMSLKCKPDKEVRFILRNMNPVAVRKEVDCVVGIGKCDKLGVKLKAEAPNAVRRRKCRKGECNCFQVRRVVNKLQRDYRDQWQRVVDYFSK
eukprot:TRINITY_DN717_c0_g1_i3.p1 TRINITY_DN717_c0_g1~~TRINITY_DN717_c0_g1_i3.p1  ORF type:complete len:112 (-),score=7.41 TRINITY_DN717_c0_g1_i3:870-1205(-)